MPPVRQARLVACGDLHITGKTPLARSQEPNWLITQIRYIQQIADIADDYSYGNGPLPIVCAGDVFDKYNPPLEIVNAMLEYMPTMYAVAGNHDLPNHRLEDIKRSGFWTLVEAKTIQFLRPNEQVNLDSRTRLWGYSWGEEPEPLRNKHDLFQDICVCHKYLWTRKTGYPGAPDAARIGNCFQQFQGFDVVISGDNHTPFHLTKNGTTFVNVGSLYRRTSDQADFKPKVWLIYDDNSVESIYLDISKDVFHKTEKKEEPKPLDTTKLQEFVTAIQQTRNEVVDFDEALERVIRSGDLSEEVKALLIQLKENKK